MSEETRSRYRVVAMIPTEMYIEADDPDDAHSSIEWLFEQYPEVDAPVSSESNNRAPMFPRIPTVEQV